MKKVIAWLLVLALTAAVSIGATLAYLTDTDEDVNVMTLGKVKIDQLEYERVDVETKDDDATVQEFHDNKPLLPAVTDKNFDYTPGDTYVDWEQIGKDGYTSKIWDPAKINNEVDKMVFVKNKGDYDAYVRSIFAFEAGNYATVGEFELMVHLNRNTTDWTWEWMQDTPVTIGGSKYFVATATYNKVLTPDALTEISLSQIALDKTATNADVEAFGETYQILVKSQGIQADGFTDPDTALNEGFGVIDTNNIPWENDSPISGVDLYTALHYIDGDTTTADITKKVSKITFGLNANYADIADNYDGTLVDIGQDVPVYAYYVPNGSNYDVYFLANDKIYTPTDCSNLCNGMSALTTVDTGNLDVSRTTNMYRMFRDCGSLQEIDVSNWNTANVTNMRDLFRGCKKLPSVDVSKWNTGKVETMLAMFQDCVIMEEIDVANWDVSNVTDMAQMFNRCNALATLDVGNWDVGNVVDMSLMFQTCKVLSGLNTTNWDTGNVETMVGMFNQCYALKELDVSNWDTGKMKNTHYMFQDCTALEELDVSKWDVSNVTNMTQMFNRCNALTTLDVANWDVGNVTSMQLMFQCCTVLPRLNTTNWDTGNVKSMNSMFNQCFALKDLDVSNWDVRNVTDFSKMFQGTDNHGDMGIKELDVSKWQPVSATTMSHMFYGCGQLTEMDLSGWNTPNLIDVNHMFADCYKLVTIDVDGWQTPALFTMDALFNHCTSLKTIDVSSITTDNVKEFSQLFEQCNSLTEIKGLEKWNTSNGASFSEMFSGCSSLKELNLSSFDTHGADESYKYHYDYLTTYSEGFERMFSGMSALEKMTLGKDFSFDGDGKVTKEAYKAKLPAPAAIDGEATKWYNAANNTYYTASEIPEPGDDAVTYVAAIPPANP